ncbi:L,D-transpeptidase [Ciceribacter sp. RN22]|uniref:L,D-transpeptidase n=1 Tax=Ciceribacter sp. RN22 TaxID=2954932 RepID=UPI002092496F|nr:L,D-transpeptidase [Ciceribacter sp. RN22]MCO6180914.1 L,D-transpeptidase [Ciceribacter sp. RN22]
MSENVNSCDIGHVLQTSPKTCVFSRRSLLGALGGLSLQSCTRALPLSEWQLDEITTGSIVRSIGGGGGTADYDRIYGPLNDGGFLLPAIPYRKINSRYRRQEIVDPTGEPSGTIVVALQQRHLYYVLPGGRAVRYGVGVGKDGFRWSGRARIQYKKAWPTWTPPEEMLQRRPDLVQYRSGMAPGLTNPLGARALYIFKDGVDTLFRIHGSPEWWTIGQAMSSGCIRMLNQDIIDLYDRAGAGTPIVVS